MSGKARPNAIAIGQLEKYGRVLATQPFDYPISRDISCELTHRFNNITERCDVWQLPTSDTNTYSTGLWYDIMLPTTTWARKIVITLSELIFARVVGIVVCSLSFPNIFLQIYFSSDTKYHLFTSWHKSSNLINHIPFQNHQVCKSIRAPTNRQYPISPYFQSRCLAHWTSHLLHGAHRKIVFATPAALVQCSQRQYDGKYHGN